MNTRRILSLLLIVVLAAALVCACTAKQNGEAQNDLPTEAPATNEPTEAPATNEPTEVPAAEIPATDVPATPEPTEEPLRAEPMTLGNGHTANFTFTTMLIYADFELPEGYELRTEKGDETRVPLNISNIEGGYIYDANGELVGAFTVYPYDAEAPEDNPEWIYAEFRMGQCHIMIEDMYEPVAEHGTVHPALTLAEAVDDDGTHPGASPEYERFICDAIIAFDTESHTKIELAFDQGYLTEEQLIAIAESIELSAEDR
ncbi:MAG: hypothetical protein J5544_00650 [Clostridia bacterium]|nr:hypothetical protein [Clostridia bacterium]